MIISRATLQGYYAPHAAGESRRLLHGGYIGAIFCIGSQFKPLCEQQFIRREYEWNEHNIPQYRPHQSGACRFNTTEKCSRGTEMTHGNLNQENYFHTGLSREVVEGDRILAIKSTFPLLVTCSLPQ